MTALTRDHLAKVAEIYNAAVPGGRPAVAVSEHWSVPVGTAHRWAAQARTAGLLPPARQGLASGDAGIVPLLAAELDIPEAVLLAAMRKHQLGLRQRTRGPVSVSAPPATHGHAGAPPNPSSTRTSPHMSDTDHTRNPRNPEAT